MASGIAPVDRHRIHDELERVRADFHHLVEQASDTGLRRRTNGTRWTNGQLLWHMAFGYLIVRRLLPLVRLFGRLPDRYSRRFAAALNAGTRPFHMINFLGGCGGALVFHGSRLSRLLDRIQDEEEETDFSPSEASSRDATDAAPWPTPEDGPRSCEISPR